MFFGVSHITIPVTDLGRAAGLWRDLIGLAAIKSCEDYLDLDSGNVILRLMQVPTIESTLSLRLSVADVPAAYQKLLDAGASPRYPAMRTPELEEMACVTDPDGHAIVLWRPLTEDEWGFVPELPKQGEWYPDAEQLVNRLLSHVPALFRMMARRKTTKVVEQLAREDNSPVTREHVIKGYITASAKVTRYRLKEPLRKEGINPEEYQAEFDYE